MYAITPTGYRGINSASDAQQGETVVDELPPALLAQLDATDTSSKAARSNLASQADQALAGLRNYRDAANPTSAQTVATVKLLCRVGITLIRLQLAKLDAVD